MIVDIRKELDKLGYYAEVLVKNNAGLRITNNKSGKSVDLLIGKDIKEGTNFHEVFEVIKNKLP
jgi:hypothetical protein